MAEISYGLTRHAQERIRERGISLSWVEVALESPDRVDPHPKDPTLRSALKKIPEKDGRVLRVVYNSTTDPWCVVSVHFDRGLRDKL